MADTTYALTWDERGDRFYETGISHGVLYVQDETGAYGDGVAWNGLTSVSESPDGAESNPIYADDLIYADIRSSEELTGTIEAYTYPDEWEVCDGSYSPVAGLVVHQQKRMPFGLCYRTLVGNDVEGIDKGYKLHLLYNATAAPSERQYETVNDSPDAITFSYEFTAIKTEIGEINGYKYKPTALLTIDSTKFTSEEQKTKLAALEAILYGGTAKPKLPSPAEVIEALS